MSGKYLINYLLLILFLPACSKSQKTMNEDREPNALIKENSPYLQQHAYNPVDWHAWHEEVLELAQKENKLLIISIGYAACHWCHVMEHESFEDSTVAHVMNDHFVSIKVDREERPDLDDIYMKVCQISSRRGCGWPLNVVALPDGSPIWAGTYFPKDQWIDILNQFVQLQQNDPAKLKTYAEQMHKGLAEQYSFQPIDDQPPFTIEELQLVYQRLKNSMDKVYGGTQGAPKFPLPVNLEALIQHHYYSGDQEALALALTTLDHIQESGTMDQVGGGFARYSTDEYWKVPHFEKMLYDNGQLLSTYAHAYQVTQDENYAETIARTYNFLTDQLMDSEGMFYASLDADSDGTEGAYYVWTEAALKEHLTMEEYDFIKDYYDIQKAGNWEHGNNVLHAPKLLRKYLATNSMPKSDAKQLLNATWDKLKKVRVLRNSPALDNKILTSWNALCITGLLDAYAATFEPAYANRAFTALNFILEHNMQDDGRLNRNYAKEGTRINGFLDDYALLIRALIKAFSISSKVEYLERAEKLTIYVIEHFSDEHDLYFYLNSNLDPSLVHRPSELNDNVIPSSNSVMAENLFLLGHLYYRDTYEQRSIKMVKQISKEFLITSHPTYYSNWLRVAQLQSSTFYQSATLGSNSSQQVDAYQHYFMPNVLITASEKSSELALFKDKYQAGSTLTYICFNRACLAPINAKDKVISKLNELHQELIAQWN